MELELNQTIIRETLRGVIVLVGLKRWVLKKKIKEAKIEMKNQNNTLKPIISHKNSYKVLANTYVIATAYSSTPDQTDASPFIAASGRRVYDGMVAANFLRFGTKIRMPQVFGDKIFTVDDRMHPRFARRIDIWFPSKNQALQFGAKRLKIEIVK